jgi:hypothetical protein
VVNSLEFPCQYFDMVCSISGTGERDELMVAVSTMEHGHNNVVLALKADGSTIVAEQSTQLRCCGYGNKMLLQIKQSTGGSAFLPENTAKR